MADAIICMNCSHINLGAHRVHTRLCASCGGHSSRKNAEVLLRTLSKVAKLINKPELCGGENTLRPGMYCQLGFDHLGPHGSGTHFWDTSRISHDR